MERYRSGHNGPDSKWSTRLFVLSTPKPSSNAGLSQFKKVNILLFCPVVLSLVFFQNFRLNIWRVVRVVEGAALEILRGAVRFVHQKPCNHTGFTRFEKLNNLLFFPSVLSKALFHRKKAGKNGGLTYTETYRSGHNENDSKSFWRDERHVGSNPTVSATKIQ